MLAISLSTTDAIGHTFGPDSREIHDQILRLDRWLGWFLDSLAVLVPRGADRVRPDAPITASSRSPSTPCSVRHEPAGRVWLGGMARDARNTLERRYGIEVNLDFDTGLITADVAALRARGVNVDSLSRALVTDGLGREGVARAFTPATLRAAPATDRDARYWKHQIPPGQGWLAAFTLRPGYTWQATAGWTSHGTTNELDVRVPIVVLGSRAFLMDAHDRPGVHGGYRADPGRPDRRPPYRTDRRAR